MRRYREPVLAAFLLAILASLGVHLPVYQALGALADHWRAVMEAEKDAAPASSVELDFDAVDSADVKEKKRDRRKTERAKRKRKAEAEKQLAQAEPAEPRQVPPVEKLSRQAIKQRSQNPDVEPPPDTNYVAEQNNRVEEETAARIRNYNDDDPNPQAGASAEADPEVMEEGNAAEQLTADKRDREGSEARAPTPEETRRQRPKDAPDADPREAERIARNANAGVKGLDGRVTITDKAGTFTIRDPSRAGRKDGGKKGKGLAIEKFSQYQAAVGADPSRESDLARIKERKSKQRGQSRDKSWKAFMAAVENFTPNVKPGNQTALNAAASPFAAYIHAVHIRIHREFADRFLRNLPVFTGSPFGDPTLRTELEIILNRDGSVHRVGVVRTSGLMPFDFGAFNSVLRGQPYPEPPKSILSGDGRVYFHWGFYRNQRQCGTFNAEPYILDNAPRTRPSDVDVLNLDTLVPRGARPTWKTRDEKREPEPEPKSKPKPKKEPARPPEKAPKVPTPPPGAAVG